MHAPGRTRAASSASRTFCSRAASSSRCSSMRCCSSPQLLASSSSTFVTCRGVLAPPPVLGRDAACRPGGGRAPGTGLRVHFPRSVQPANTCERGSRPGGEGGAPSSCVAALRTRSVVRHYCYAASARSERAPPTARNSTKFRAFSRKIAKNKNTLYSLLCLVFSEFRVFCILRFLHFEFFCDGVYNKMHEATFVPSVLGVENRPKNSLRLTNVYRTPGHE